MRKLSLLLFAVAALITRRCQPRRHPRQRRTSRKSPRSSGDGVCAKCALGETKTCQNVIVIVKEEATRR